MMRLASVLICVREVTHYTQRRAREGARSPSRPAATERVHRARGGERPRGRAALGADRVLPRRDPRRGARVGRGSGLVGSRAAARRRPPARLMASVLLDTTVLIDLLRGRGEAGRRLRALREAGDLPCTPAVNVEETVR